MYDISTLPEYRDSTSVFQVSSYDTTGGNNDGFNGNYSYLRKNSDGSLVIFDQKGSGVINRIWTPTPTNDTLDFYLDGSVTPTFSIQFSDLFSGLVYPFIKPLCGNESGGYFCYLPIPFEKACKIIFRGKTIQFHQIQYRLFSKGARVKSFSPVLQSEERDILDKTARLWGKTNWLISDFCDSTENSTLSKTFELKPGGTKTLYNAVQGGRIMGIELEPASAFEGIEKQVDLKISWDDETIPAVYCPAADFFGYAFGSRSMKSLLAGSRDGNCYSYIPMPYDNSAKIELIYRKVERPSGEKTIKIKSSVFYNSEKRDVKREGKFYSCWSRQMYTETGKPFVFADIKGKGHFIGTILQAQGKKPGMTLFFEGDDSTAVDGIMSSHGTGSEDYFNGGWYAFMDCWDARFSLPVHGCLDYSLPYCRTGGYRFYLSDKIPFGKSFFHSIEHGGIGNTFPADYTSLSFFYCDSPLSKITKPENTLTKVYIPDTLVVYPQLMSYNIWEGFSCKTKWAYNTGGMSFIFTVSTETKIRISLADLPKGKYKVYADFEKNNEGCDFSFWQRQTQVSDWISSYNQDKERVEMQYISDISLDEFRNTISLKFKTTNGSCFFFNRLVFVGERMR
jgi:hypothetical protein